MQAIILARRDFRENDQIISLFTPEKGKISVLARGVKKIISKNSACLEPFFFVEAEIVPGREIRHLTKAVALESFKNIRADLDKSLLAAKAVSIVDRLTEENEREVAVFNLLLRWLQFVDKNIVGSVHLFGFISRFFKIIGFTPVLDKCVVCGKKLPAGIKAGASLYFLPASGGLVCRECKIAKKIQEANVISWSDIKDWKKFLEAAIAAWPVKISPKLKKTIWDFAEYHSERKLAKISGI